MNYYEQKAKAVHAEGINQVLELINNKRKAVEKLQNPYANLELYEALQIEIREKVSYNFKTIKELILQGGGV